jgi:FMN-dependent NADH-azoreductase
MSKLLYITASPRGDASESIALAETFLAECALERLIV